MTSHNCDHPLAQPHVFKHQSCRVDVYCVSVLMTTAYHNDRALLQEHSAQQRSTFTIRHFVNVEELRRQSFIIQTD